MLVAISGSQGSGKTTTLNELTKLGFNVVERKSARSVMTEQFPGMTLDDLYATPATAQKWQEAILARKIEDEREASESDKLWFTERSYADLFTYAVMAVGKNNAYSDWVDDYYNRCRDNTRKYLHTFYIEGGKFKPVADGVRGTNQHYQAMIDNTLSRVSYQMVSGDDSFSYQFSTVSQTEVLQRVDYIASRSFQEFLAARIPPQLKANTTT